MYIHTCIYINTYIYIYAYSRVLTVFLSVMFLGEIIAVVNKKVATKDTDSRANLFRKEKTARTKRKT